MIALPTFSTTLQIPLTAETNPFKMPLRIFAPKSSQSTSLKPSMIAPIISGRASIRSGRACGKPCANATINSIPALTSAGRLSVKAFVITGINAITLSIKSGVHLVRPVINPVSSWKPPSMIAGRFSISVSVICFIRLGSIGINCLITSFSPSIRPKNSVIALCTSSGTSVGIVETNAFISPKKPLSNDGRIELISDGADCASD